MMGGMTLADLYRDLLEAARGLRRAPGFTIVVTLTLAVGLGGSLATISVMDRVLFRPPSGVSEPHELRRVHLEYRPRRLPNLVTSTSLSYPDFEDLMEAGSGRASLALYSATTRRLGTDGLVVSIEFVGHGYFSVLGVRPLLGRFFTAEESRPSSPAVDPLVMSAAFWRREFGGDSSALGRTVMLNGRSFTVVGIAQPDFRGMDLNPTDVWAPVGSALAPGTGEGGSIHDRGRKGWLVVARLEHGDWPELLTRFTTRLHESHRSEPWVDTVARVIARPLNDSWDAGARGGLAVRNASLAVRLAFVATAVLVVSIVHGAIMLSLRALHRRREIAIRLALGMPRSRFVLHHVFEALSVAALAGGAAVLIGWWGATVLDARVLSTLRPAAVVLDGRLIAVALLLAATAFAVTGLVPALTSRGISPTALRSGGVAGDAGDSSLRQHLVAAETAACVALVMLAALSLRSLQRIAKADFGFDGDRLITLEGPFGVDVSPLRERVAALPFVESASVGDHLAAGSRNIVFAVPERDPIPDSLVPTSGSVANDYLRTVGARVLYGRSFAETDVAGVQKVVVITRSMAERFWPDGRPLGQCILAIDRQPSCRYVVGVIEDLRWGPGAPASPRFFVSSVQEGYSRGRIMLIRTRQRALATDAATIEELARHQWVDLTPRPRAIRVVDALQPQLAPLQAATTLFLLFGVLALVSAAGGVYGLISYLVSSRTREIGIRIALGASALAVAHLVARWAVAPLLVGVGIGVFGALAGGRLVAAFLFETAGYEPSVFGGVIVVVVLTALAGALAPARRAATLDPAVALRVE
jgi:putative ABC transport system permease protein